MNYKSFNDLSLDICNCLNKIPREVDLVVGIPRSGMIPAYMIGLQRNLPVCDLNSFLENKGLANGITRKIDNDNIKFPEDAKSILIVDDSIASGNSLEIIKKRVEAAGLTGKVRYAVVYATEKTKHLVDYHLKIVSLPRYFQWNLMHRSEATQFCFDIDGVLCLDPTSDENDDGPRYRRFLENAKALCLPSYEVGYLVTSRLEKYRAETERWLSAHGLRYKRLFMLNMNSAEERRKASVHGKFKAEVYKSLDDAVLFIESESMQAIEIAKISGKPVLDFGQQILVRPTFNPQMIKWKAKSLVFRARGKLRNKLQALFSRPSKTP